MRVIRTVSEMEAERARTAGSVGLVPTMGYLHEGHVSLVRRARTDDDHVVVSIFVNPTQFGPNEDFERYPRDEARDLAKLESEGVDTVFAPSDEEMYPPGFDDWVEVSGPVTERLEGEHRPGHFRGVTTVVARLFRIVRPDRAYFGQKDAQQLRVIRRMVADQGLPVEVAGRPTVREADGLAMSSRNVYLSPQERQAALVLSRSLQRAQVMVAEGEWDAARIQSEVEGMIQQEPLVALDYVSVADDETLEELTVVDRPALLLVAARVGKTRLIDNTLLLPIDDLPVGRG
jgi:pantoate--beta-alanine ligase